MIIQRAVRADSGTYTCTVTTNTGVQRTGTARLSVTVPSIPGKRMSLGSEAWQQSVRVYTYCS